MSVISSREVARKIARRRVGLGFIDRRRPNNERVPGMQDVKLKRSSRLPREDLVLASVRVPTPAATARRVFHDRTHGLAKRVPPAKNMKTARGWIFHNDVIVYHESELEHRVSLRLSVRNDIAQLHSQAVVFNYRDEDGKMRQHTADYLSIYKDGYIQAVVVKHEKKRTETEDLIRRIQMDPSARQVHSIVLRTEAYGTIEAGENAHLIRWSRAYHDQADIDELLAVLQGKRTWFRFGSLLRDCESVARRRAAIWRLIDVGILFSITGEKITELSFLGFAPGGSATGLQG